MRETGENMVTIITGGIGAGKTTRMLSLYKQTRQGDGLALPKIYSGETYVGQRLLRLSSMDGPVFSIREGHIPPGWTEACRIGPFSFSQEGLTFFDAAAEEIYRGGISPVYLDEIGPLELSGRGFDPWLRRFLAADRALFIAVREGSLQAVLKKYEIVEYRLETVQDDRSRSSASAEATGGAQENPLHT